MSVGYCLHTISPTFLLRLFLKSGIIGIILKVKNNGHGFIKNNNKNITIEPLNHWAKIDDYEGWKNITRDSVSTFINQ